MPKSANVTIIGFSLTECTMREASRYRYSVLAGGAPVAPGLSSRCFSDRSGEKPALIVTSSQNHQAAIAQTEISFEHVPIHGVSIKGLASRILEENGIDHLRAAYGVPPSLSEPATQFGAGRYRDRFRFEGDGYSSGLARC